VIAAAKVASPDTADPGGYEALVKDIVWSAQPREAAKDLVRLKALATLPAKMREALAGIGAQGADVEPFLASLAAAHAKALHGDTREEVSAAQSKADMIDWDADALPWLTPQEVQDSMLMQATEFASTVREDAASRNGKAIVAELASGHTIEVMAHGSWSRWKLVWTSPHGTMLMFTGAGGRPESVTRAALAKMFDAGSARLVADRSVVDSALDAVAQAALENSSHESPVDAPGEAPQSPM
jgi:hypothetical protein